ncbi:hypothetical protein HR060_10590 [Catenovulum sp. SM1970]|uniref:hypothetical protein n=1 Tax=Marinifaba aquimaris TaxID=2741323 RepID=UPI001573BEBF|nr:hypothetical protein [Marinifaba aquimaris]NTS77311.1 hypothetical protein [Marinifaba aquimaris]
MSKKRPTLFVFIAGVILILILVSQHFNADLKSKKIAENCDLNQEICVVRIEPSIELSLITSPIEIETIETLIITSAISADTVKGYVAGLNMNMGKIPILFNRNKEDEWLGEFALGMCTEPKMQWLLVLEITIADKVLEKSVIFETDQTTL